MDDLEGNRLEDFGVDLGLGEVDEFHAELVGQGGHDVVFLGEAALDDDFVQGPIGRGGVRLRDARQNVLGKDPLAYQALQQLHAGLESAENVRTAGDSLNPVTCSG